MQPKNSSQLFALLADQIELSPCNLRTAASYLRSWLAASPARTTSVPNQILPPLDISACTSCVELRPQVLVARPNDHQEDSRVVAPRRVELRRSPTPRPQAGAPPETPSARARFVYPTTLHLESLGAAGRRHQLRFGPSWGRWRAIMLCKTWTASMMKCCRLTTLPRGL